MRSPQLRLVDPGWIFLRDEGSQRTWRADVAAFELAEVPVTRELFGASGLQPATDVSWFDAIDFCNRLSTEHGLDPFYERTGDDVVTLETNGYRLPTEAEWEYACRAGSAEARYGALDEIAWHRGNADGPQPVGTKAPNDWGFYDMIGNVWEWCFDLYDPEVYGEYRVFRGGGWNDLPNACRAACRRKSHPTFRIDDLGFRLARSVPK